MEDLSAPSLAETGGSFGSLADLAHKRIATFAYLRKLHDGNSYYLSTVLLPSDALAVLYDNTKTKKRAIKWFNLGLSLGSLLLVPNHIEFLKAANSVMMDYEADMESSKPGLTRLFSAKKSTSDLQSAALGGSKESLALPASLLESAQLPFEIDYVQALSALCDIFMACYNKLMELEELEQSTVFLEGLLKFDTRAKKIIGLVLLDVDQLAKNLLREELEIINPTNTLFGEDVR
ncbi:uncharacterized protein BJ171DRAFT_507906 [Polychytrium aggregatum]|uniref:uncharacterized protein n=1 Tax=Polychytrium aggregatum TaxID=110093 RepID=UPI0022FEBE5A|nr:uncharacterized protein BJ171DRAFT_507906 [Polychytrium aggregatum]KAI9203775.1 hypothetical protein BJ171DRAFT_507906 [Polychytrium aggregatum]